MSDEIKEILIAAAHVVLMRYGDVTTGGGRFATVDADAISRLECAMAEHFELESGDVTFENIHDLIAKIRQE